MTKFVTGFRQQFSLHCGEAWVFEGQASITPAN